MPPKVRCTVYQKRRLVEYMSLHPLFANGEFSGPLGAQKYEAEWQTLADSLREYGPVKPVAAWKITWRDLKRKAREDNAAARRATAVTGNSCIIPVVGEEEQMVLQTIGVASSEGIGPAESRIGDVEDALPQCSSGSVSSCVSPVSASLAFWAPPFSSSFDAGVALHAPPARHTGPARVRHASPAPARPAPYPRHPAPSSHPDPVPAPVHARTRPRIRTSEPAGFLQLQQEHNDIMKDMLIELRRSNDLRAQHLEVLRSQNHRPLDDTQPLDFLND